MRQRRQGLQVSTFPFLAVLLCAMGSLILLLLVIDRRAKIVARVKAMRAVEQAQAATALDEKAAALHRAEWERRRKKLHEQLLEQDQQIVNELQAVQSKSAGAVSDTEMELARNRGLQEQLQGERAGLARFEEELTAQRAETARSAEQAGAAGAELARLTADLERMERALADLKAARERRQQMYSLVPYRGKRGDNRKPIYLECSRDELIFHPDRLAFRGMMLTASSIHDEVERRLAQQRSEMKAVSDKPEENAYLLLLIRPNGITTYYQTVAALRGLRIDFGYEFIDQDWLLDFSENDNVPKKQPWIMADRAKEIQPSGPAGRVGAASGSSATGGLQKHYAGLSASGSDLGHPVGILAPESAGRGNGVFGNGSVGGGRQGSFGAVTAGNSAVGSVQSGAVQTIVGGAPPGTGQGPFHKGLAGPGGGTADGPYVNSAGTPGAATQDHIGLSLQGGGMPNRGSGDGNGASFADVLAGGRSSAGRQSSPNRNLVMAPQPPAAHGLSSGQTEDGPDLGPTIAGVQRGMTEEASGSPSAQGSGTGQLQGERPPGGGITKPALDAPPNSLPLSAADRSRIAANPGDSSPRGPASDGVDRGAEGQGGSGGGEPVRHGTSDPLDQLKAQNAPRTPVRGLPARPGPLLGNRDWIIPIECTADALVLHPYGQRIATRELSNADRAHNVLLETVQRMIARRQATVRPGEPPYRPMIRFRVWPDGLRSYYLAYPALEALHVPMSRENLDPREDKTSRSP